jgi:hypothetical protein
LATSKTQVNPGAGVALPVQRESLPEIAALPPDVVPIHVLGLSQSEVRRLLGPPATTSVKGARESWTYDRAECSVEIGFYYDVTRSSFYALSEHLPSGRDEQDCLSNVHDHHAS